MTECVQILGVLSARSIFNERLISCVRTREKWPFHHFLTLAIDKCSEVERNKLSDHFNCILVVRIDSTTCDRNMKENYFGVQNRVERFKGDGLLKILNLVYCISAGQTCLLQAQWDFTLEGVFEHSNWLRTPFNMAEPSGDDTDS